MKIISWNSNRSFYPSKENIEDLQADLYIIQEVKHPDKWSVDERKWLDGVYYKYLNFTNRYIEDGEHVKSSDLFGVLAYSHKYELESWDLPDHRMRYFQPFVCNGQKVVNVWTKDNSTEDLYVYVSVNKASLMDTVIMGDFNSNTNHDKPLKTDYGSLKEKKKIRAYRGMLDFNDLANEIGLHSGYHHQKNISIEDDEIEKTHKNNRGGWLHIDYCYLPKKITKYHFQIESEHALTVGLSGDHYPISIDF